MEKLRVTFDFAALNAEMNFQFVKFTAVVRSFCYLFFVVSGVEIEFARRSAAADFTLGPKFLVVVEGATAPLAPAQSNGAVVVGAREIANRTEPQSD